MKTLLIDLTSLYNRKITGLEIYGIELYQSLLMLNEFKVIPVFNYKNTIDNNVNAIILKSKNRLFTELVQLPLLIKKIEPHAVLFPIFPPSIMCYYLKKEKTKLIPTIHDLAFIHYSETLSMKARIYLTPSYKKALKKADHIITISDTIKKEIELISKIQITNLGNQISTKFQNTEHIKSAILEKLEVKSNDYFISVSTIEPRKNMIYLLEIINSLKKIGVDKKIVLVGRKGWENETKFSQAYNNNKQNIIFTDYINDDDLIFLYKNCLAFILVSKYEGFGRPPLEALYSNAKVFVSNIPIFHEILSDNCFYLPLDNAPEAANIIKRNLHVANNALASRESKYFNALNTNAILLRDII